MSRWQLRQSVGRAIAQIQTYVMKSLQLILSERITKSWSKKHVHFLCLFAIGLILSTAISACGNASASNDIKLRLVSFSVTKAAHDQIIPKFVEKWKKEHNQNVTFDTNYGGSGAQAAAVIKGSQEADIVHLALPLDVNKI